MMTNTCGGPAEFGFGSAAPHHPRPSAINARSHTTSAFLIRMDSMLRVGPELRKRMSSFIHPKGEGRKEIRMNIRVNQAEGFPILKSEVQHKQVRFARATSAAVVSEPLE